MKKTFILALILTFTISCEKVTDDLLDPAEAGIWTLYNTTKGLPGNQVRGIKGDSKGNMWFAVSSNGVAKYYDNKWTYYKTSNSQILSNGVTCIEEDLEGNIFFGTTNGFSMLSPTNDWSYYRDPGISIDVTSIKAISDGTIWLGTYTQGFFVIEDNIIYQYKVSPYETVNDIEEDSKGNIWIGTDYGLIKWDGSKYSFITMANGLPDDIVTSIFNDSKGRLWVGTYFGETVSWIDNGGIHKLSLFNGDTASEINDIWEDRKGDIWFATFDSGLIRYDGVISHSYKKYNGFIENDVISIGEDNVGNIWFGLYSKGLLKYTLPID